MVFFSKPVPVSIKLNAASKPVNLPFTAVKKPLQIMPVRELPKTLTPVPLASIVNMNIVSLKECGGIKFYLDAPAEVSDDKLQEIAGFITAMNNFIAERPVTSVTIAKDCETSYDPKSNSIKITLEHVKSADILKLVAHEMGHALYRSKGLPSQRASESIDEWDLVYAACLGSNGFMMVIDSIYISSIADAGHPYDNPDELFASTVAMYIRSSNTFFEMISNGTVKIESHIKAGKMLYCYLRDEVFNGVFKDGNFYPKGTAEYDQHNVLKAVDWRSVFMGYHAELHIINALKSDNIKIKETVICFLMNIIGRNIFSVFFKSLKTKERTITLDHNKLVRTLIEVYKTTHNNWMRSYILDSMQCLDSSDIEFIKFVAEAMKDPDPKISESAYNCAKFHDHDYRFASIYGAMLQCPNASVSAKARVEIEDSIYKDECLRKCLSEKDTQIRIFAMESIREIGKQNKLWIEPLLASLEDSDTKIVVEAARTIAKLNIKHKRLPQLLIRMLQDKDDHVTEEAAKTIAQLKLKDKRFIPHLVSLLKDDEIDVVGSASSALSIQKINRGKLADEIMEMLGDKSLVHGYYIYRVIGELGIKDDRFIRPLILASKSEDAWIRDSAEESIKKLEIDIKALKYTHSGIIGFIGSLVGRIYN